MQGEIQLRAAKFMMSHLRQQISARDQMMEVYQEANSLIDFDNK